MPTHDALPSRLDLAIPDDDPISLAFVYKVAGVAANITSRTFSVRLEAPGTSWAGVAMTLTKTDAANGIFTVTYPAASLAALDTAVRSKLAWYLRDDDNTRQLVGGRVTLAAHGRATRDADSGAYTIDVVDNTVEVSATELVTMSASTILANILTVDGAGSGLDADLLDGQQGAFYTADATAKANAAQAAAIAAAAADATAKANAAQAASQPLDADLTAIAGLTSAADRLPYFTGSGTAALATFTAAGRALVDDADAAAQRATLDVPSRAEAARSIIDRAVLWLDARAHDGGQTWRNLGWGGSALDARLGASSAVGTDDPTWLGHDGENYLYLPGASGNYATVPDEAALDVTGDLEIVRRIAPSDWTPSGTSTLVGKWDSGSNQRSYRLDLITGGLLTLWWSDNGTTTLSASSTAGITATDGTALWVKATIDVDNGASGRTVRFWTAADASAEPSSWTQLGADVTTAGVTSIYAGTSGVHIGALFGGASGLFAAKDYRTIIRNGIGGSTVLDVDFTKLTSGGQTSMTADTGQTVTINRATSGAKTVAVVRPTFLFDGGDYAHIDDHPLLDASATQDLTVVAVCRIWGTQSSGNPLVTKQTGTLSAGGWRLVVSTDGNTRFDIGDGTNSVTGATRSYTAGTLAALTGVRSVGADTVGTFSGSSGATTTDTTTDTLATAHAFRVAGWSGAGGTTAFEVAAVLVFREALSDAEVAAVHAAYTADDITVPPRSATPLVVDFTSSGTFNKADYGNIPASTPVTVLVQAAGGGGGSGRRGVAGSARWGGGGGGGGGSAQVDCTWGDLPATLTVTVGAAGGGGSAQTADSTDGVAGTAGSTASMVGTGFEVRALGGTAGSGGTASAGSGGAARTSGAMFPSAAGGSSSVSAAASTSAFHGTVASGPGGGGISTGNTAYAGGDGYGSVVAGGSTAPGTAAGGAATGAAGTAASSSGLLTHPFAGRAGGGGGANASGAGGAGGAGAGYGYGGAGGGASVNGSNSGAGGAGGPGFIRLIIGR